MPLGGSSPVSGARSVTTWRTPCLSIRCCTLLSGPTMIMRSREFPERLQIERRCIIRRKRFQVEEALRLLAVQTLRLAKEPLCFLDAEPRELCRFEVGCKAVAFLDERL